jgi:hypothetical protein
MLAGLICRLIVVVMPVGRLRSRSGGINKSQGYISMHPNAEYGSTDQQPSP